MKTLQLILLQEEAVLREIKLNTSYKNLPHWEWKGQSLIELFDPTTKSIVKVTPQEVFYARIRGDSDPSQRLVNLCTNKACVNPEHYDLVSIVKNPEMHPTFPRWLRPNG